jgi:hypothetical protein
VKAGWIDQASLEPPAPAPSSEDAASAEATPENGADA